MDVPSSLDPEDCRFLAQWRGRRTTGGRNYAGIANGFGESASDHAVILHIQGRRYPCLCPTAVEESRGNQARRAPGRNYPLCICFENIMKITSHHLMITGLAIRFNLRLIPLLLLFLGYTRGMPHVLRFGEKTYNLLQSLLATLIICICACLFVFWVEIWGCTL